MKILLIYENEYLSLIIVKPYNFIEEIMLNSSKSGDLSLYFHCEAWHLAHGRYLAYVFKKSIQINLLFYKISFTFDEKLPEKTNGLFNVC